MNAPTLHVNDLYTSLWEGNVDLGDGETLTVTITHEGIIMDHFIGETGEVSSTVGMTFDEWTDWMRWDAVNAESDAIRSVISENFNQELEGQLSLTEDS